MDYQMNDLNKKLKFFTNRCQELELINAKFLQQMENVVTENGNINGSPKKTQMLQEQDRSQIEIQELKTKLALYDKSQKIEFIVSEIQFWKKKYEEKNCQYAELFKQYQKLNQIVQNQDQNQAEKSKEILLFENKQQSQEMVVMIQDKHILQEENQRLRMTLDRWINGEQEQGLDSKQQINILQKKLQEQQEIILKLQQQNQQVDQSVPQFNMALDFELDNKQQHKESKTKQIQNSISKQSIQVKERKSSFVKQSTEVKERKSSFNKQNTEIKDKKSVTPRKKVKSRQN